MESAAGKPTASSSNSGKLLIVGILLVAFCGAAISWWFRYNATHRAARFWGREVAELIRDAPQVALFRKPTGEVVQLALSNPKRALFDDSSRDISNARGLVHLRTALLEDWNFKWPEEDKPLPVEAIDTSWVLSFHDPTSRKTALIRFSEDCTQAWRTTEHLLAYKLTNIGTEPAMANGLREMFAEFAGAASANSGAKPQAANEAVAPAR